MSERDRPSILIVEDSITNVEILLENLKELYTVRVAVDGEKALKTIAKKTPDMILLDVMLPGMDGFELCRRLKADSRTADVPVIFLTGKSNPKDKLDGLKSGACDFLTKPFDINEVKSKIQTHLSQAE